MKIVNFYIPPGKVYSSDQLELILNYSLSASSVETWMLAPQCSDPAFQTSGVR